MYPLLAASTEFTNTLNSRRLIINVIGKYEYNSFQFCYCSPLRMDQEVTSSGSPFDQLASNLKSALQARNIHLWVNDFDFADVTSSVARHLKIMSVTIHWYHLPGF